jgi:hypothetical protein
VYLLERLPTRYVSLWISYPQKVASVESGVHDEHGEDHKIKSVFERRLYLQLRASVSLALLLAWS